MLISSQPVPVWPSPLAGVKRRYTGNEGGMDALLQSITYVQWHVSGYGTTEGGPWHVAVWLGNRPWRKDHGRNGEHDRLFILMPKGGFCDLGFTKLK